MVQSITPGQTATAYGTVTEKSTAQAIGSGSLAVFSTPMMIAVMEEAACLCLADNLEEGQTTVGVSLCIDHTAACSVGAKIAATATVTAVSGRTISFTVAARDGAGEIGRGTHTRAIVDAERFMKKAAARTSEEKADV